MWCCRLEELSEALGRLRFRVAGPECKSEWGCSYEASMIRASHSSIGDVIGISTLDGFCGCTAYDPESSASHLSDSVSRLCALHTLIAQRRCHALR